MKLYFGNGVTTATTILLFVLLGFLGDSIWHRENIVYWGRRTLFVLLFGLLICCFAAARDGLDKTIQHAIDGSCAPGLFPLVSVPTLIASLWGMNVGGIPLSDNPHGFLIMCLISLMLALIAVVMLWRRKMF